MSNIPSTEWLGRCQYPVQLSTGPPLEVEWQIAPQSGQVGEVFLVSADPRFARWVAAHLLGRHARPAIPQHHALQRTLDSESVVVVRIRQPTVVMQVDSIGVVAQR